MFSVLSSEGWRTVDLLDIVAVFRGDDAPSGMYVSAVLVMVGGAKRLPGRRLGRLSRRMVPVTP